MQHSPADVVRWLLISLGQGTDPSLSGDWPIYATGEPDTPDNCVTVYDTQGTPDGRSMVDGELWDHEGIHIRVRSQEHPEGWAKTDALRTSISQGVSLDQVTVGGTSYLVHCLAHIGQVIPIGKDIPHSKRSLFTLNATVAVRELS